MFEEGTTQDQSSFVPYHDSWADNSRHRSAVQHRSMTRGGGNGNRSVNKIDGQMSQAGGVVVEGQRSVVEGNMGTYHTLIGAPVMSADGGGERSNEMNHIMEQSFTQFEIPHPKQTAPASTPAGRRLISE